METVPSQTMTFGDYELDITATELRRKGRPIRVQPQPFRLLVLLVTRAGATVTREEIRRELWPEDTFVDFDQGVNFCIRQIREVLRDEAERPLYVQTVPRRGYRFIAPVGHPPKRGIRPTGVDTKLSRALWANIAELRLADIRRRKVKKTAIVVSAVVGAVLLVVGYMLFPW